MLPLISKTQNGHFPSKIALVRTEMTNDQTDQGPKWQHTLTIHRSNEKHVFSHSQTNAVINCDLIRFWYDSAAQRLANSD